MRRRAVLAGLALAPWRASAQGLQKFAGALELLETVLFAADDPPSGTVSALPDLDETRSGRG